MTDNSRQSYLGNPRLKRAGAQMEYTPEQIKEYIKCSKDQIYFIKEYVKIVHIDRGLVDFKLYPFQEELAEKILNNRFVIARMPRQSGKSTCVVAILLWYALFNENYNMAILAHKAEMARELLGRLQLAYENLPKWIQQGVVEWNKGNIELENGSKILASATSSGAIRGRAMNLVYLDEFAHVPNNVAEAFFASVYPTISSGKTSKILITSTPLGLNLYYKIWKDSEEGRNTYVRVDVHWSDVPGRDAAWKKETIANTSEAQFEEEFECHFIGSQNTLISGAKLRSIPYITPREANKFMSVYEYPEAGRQYAMVVDSGHGGGADYSAFIVFDISEVPYNVVCVYRNNVIPHLLYPDVIYRTALHYNNALTLVETNDIGQSVADAIYYDYEYEYIISTTTKGRSGQVIGGGFGASKTGLGVKTSQQVKRIGAANMKTLIEEDKIIVNDYNLLSELSTFVSKGKSYEAEPGRHDDLAMCLLLFSWMSNQTYFKDLSGHDIRKIIHEENEQRIQDEMIGFVVDDGQDDLVEENGFTINSGVVEDGDLQGGWENWQGGWSDLS